MGMRVASALPVLFALFGAGAASAQSPGEAAASQTPTVSTPATTVAPAGDGSAQVRAVATPVAPSRSSATGGNAGGGAQ